MSAGIKANNDGSAAIQVGGVDLLTLTPTNRIQGDFSNATVANRVSFQTSTVNGVTDIPVIPNGTGANARHFYYSSSDTANASLLTAGVVGTEATFRASAVGSGTSPAMTFYTGGSERLRIATDGQQSSWCVDAVRPEYKCRAWVNFNGTGTVAIRASGNVTSITDNGAGDYTVNFTTAMPDANYAVSMSVFPQGDSKERPELVILSSGSVRVQNDNGLNVLFDTPIFTVAIFR